RVSSDRILRDTCWCNRDRSLLFKLRREIRHRMKGRLGLQIGHKKARSKQIFQLSLEESCVALPSINAIEDYHSLRLPLLPMMQREIGEEVWSKLEFGHRGKSEYATVLDPVSQNLRRDGTRYR